MNKLQKNKKGVFGWLSWAVIFLVVAVIAGLFGFGVISGASYTIAIWLAIIFGVLFVISTVAHVIKTA